MHQCCDICEKECQCEVCLPVLTEEVDQVCEAVDEADVTQPTSSAKSSTSSTRQLTKDEDALFMDLQTYRNCLCRTDDGYVTPLFGFEIASGIPDSILKRIALPFTVWMMSSNLASLVTRMLQTSLL